MVDELPILPAHIQDTVRAIAELHDQHRRDATALQHIVERLTAAIGRPRFIGGLTLLLLGWMVVNGIIRGVGGSAFDPPPFNWLQGAVGVLALYVTILILTTQRRDDQLASYREQLALELAILSEQKTAKVIALLEEMRRDDPHLRDRVDPEAEAMAIPSDPQVVFDAIKESDGPTQIIIEPDGV